MEWSFYDVKVKAKVTAQITGKQIYGEGAKTRYAFKALTADKRPLNAFVNKADFDKCKAKLIK